MKAGRWVNGRWLEGDQNSGRTLLEAPSKTSKTLFDVFEGSVRSARLKIDCGTKAEATEFTEPDRDELARAEGILADSGTRLMEIGSVFAVGIWSDLDSPELRAAIRVFHPDGMPRILYLDGADVPPRFKLRSVPGDPVPLSVLEAMEQNPEEPWVIRDRMLFALEEPRILEESPRSEASKTSKSVFEVFDGSLQGPPSKIEGARAEASRGSQESRKTRFRPPLVKVTPRREGMTVIFGEYEWLYAPAGITKSTVKQLEELSSQGEEIQVIEWREGKGEVVFDQGAWKDRAIQKDPPTESEPSTSTPQKGKNQMRFDETPNPTEEPGTCQPLEPHGGQPR